MKLSDFFIKNKKAAVAFSGGVDSSYLLYEALRAGADIKAYYVKSAFQPEFELVDAKRLARELGADLKIISVDITSDKTIVSNPANRCYYCKQRIFEAIIGEAEKDGYSLILDGTNASDDQGDRPGMKALNELNIRSPLRECSLTKGIIRKRSRDAGLFTWDKPAYACLATRIAAGEKITDEKLKATEEAEAYLYDRGYRDFRIRTANGAAKIQLCSRDFEKFIGERSVIFKEMKNYYSGVTLDLEARDEQ